MAPPPLFNSMSRFDNLTRGRRYFRIKKIPKKSKYHTELRPPSPVSEPPPIFVDEAFKFRFFERMKDATVSVIFHTLCGEKVCESLGSGTIIHIDGEDIYILTCAHILAIDKTESKLETVKVQLFNRKKYKVKPMFIDEDYDLAILKLHHSGKLKLKLFVPKFAKVENIHVGLSAYLISNPQGNGFTLGEGIVSCDKLLNWRSLGEGEKLSDDAILVGCDGECTEGNSGCSIFSSNGQIMGVVVCGIKEGMYFGIHLEIIADFLKAASEALGIEFCC